MKILKSKKILIAVLLTLALLIGTATFFIVGLLRGQELEQLRNEALEELERDIGQYDEQSIVLYQTSKAQAEELSELLDAELRITEDGRFAKLTLAEGTTIRDVYANDDMLEHIEKMSADYQVHVSELTEDAEEETGERLPTRPQYSVTDSDYELQTYLDYLNMKNVWSSYTGSGVTVAVIDTGIDTDHPEFAGRISEYSYNATEDKIVKDWTDENGNYDWSLIEDEVGHGTAVTGVIAASMNNGGIVGIAPNVNIIVIKAECDQDGSFKRTSDLVFGIYYAIERDVSVVNMSFGMLSVKNPFAEATQLAYDSDIVCIASAGNDGSSALNYPAADPNVIGVGALGENSWELASYSNYGENTDLVAPGTAYTACVGGSYKIGNGTSLSAPIVAGAVALFAQNSSYATVDDIKEVLYASCTDLGDLGWDWSYGFGALDMSAFLLEARGTITYDMLTDELDNIEGLFIKGHTLQELPEPERLYAVFDGWYYDDTFTQEYAYYEDPFYDDITLYAKWVNEDDGVPFTYVELEDGTIEIRSYTGKRRFITIPERIDGKIVSSIGEEAFMGQTRLREVGLPSGLKQIRRSAFEGCSNLIWMHIPEKVESIGECAFMDNTRLSTIAFLGTSNLQIVDDYAFAHCGRLESIELPASLESINATAFYGDFALHTIGVQSGNEHFTAPDGVLYNQDQSVLVVYPVSHGNTYTLHENTREIGIFAFAFAQLDTIDLAAVENIGNYAFVSSTLESLIIPDSVSSMGSSAFMSNAELLEVKVGSGLSDIAYRAFNGCDLLRHILIPNGIKFIDIEAFENSGLEVITFEEGSVLTIIGAGAFYNCNISEIDIPATVTEIGGGAFSGLFVGNPLVRVGFAQNSSLQVIGAGAFEHCNLLEQIELPVGLEIIGDFAFADTALTGISIPASVTSLGNGAFAYCSGLPAIEIEEGNTVYYDLDGIVYTLDNVTICAYPAGNTQQFYSLEATTRNIMPYSFAGTVYLYQVNLPEGLEIINEYAFIDCGATTYSLPYTLTNIMGHAFYQNENLRTIYFPDALTQIAEYAFSKCTSLTSVYIPDNVLQIGRYAFAEDWKLYSITFNETSKLPRISYGAFAYTGLYKYTVPANVSTIAQHAFEGCNSLYSITFAENSQLESISAYMFDGCSILQNITFMPGSSLNSIQAHGLEGMTYLSAIDLTNTQLTNIDNFAFRFCKNLQSLTLPSTVKNVGRYAFYACKSLSELSLPEPLEHIGSYAFLGTHDLNLYLASESMPAYLDENWDHGIRGYYTGVTEVRTEGDYEYAVLSSGNIAIIKYLGTETIVDLTTVNLGAPIVTIGGSAFKDSTVTSIVLPETLTTIQAEAFQYTALESITIPANVTFIGREAFAHTDIKSLMFADDSKLAFIEQYAFEGTKNLTTVTLPQTLTTMGTGAFSESGLTSLTFEDGINLKEIPQKAFMGTKLMAVQLPDSVETVNHNAFRDIRTLKTVDFGNSNGIRLLSNVFYNTGLETLHIPENVTYIGEYCFVGLENLTEITVDANNPNYISVDGLLLTKSGRKLIAVPAGRTGTLDVPLSIEEIGFGAFENTALDEVHFDKDANILTFGYRAFFGAKNLTELHVPASVVSIDYYAFAYCEKLQTVTFAEDNKLKGIYEGAFCGDINLQNITIPGSIVEISDFAFYGCTKIDKLPLGENHAVKGIYDYAFAYTSIGGEFTAPETLVDIGEYAFLGTDITKLTILDTNKKDLIIGIGAFEGCNKLTEVTLPFIGASYEDEKISWFGYIFGAGAYQANSIYVPESLETVTITDGITFIGISGFSECTSLKKINVPHSVSVLWNDAFKDTTAKYTLTNSIMVIGTDNREGYLMNTHLGSGFYGELYLAEGITQMDYNSFDMCTGITKVSFPGSMRIVDGKSLSKCQKLESLVFRNGVEEIYSFRNHPNLKEVTIISDSVEIAGAFEGCASLQTVNIVSNKLIIGGFSQCHKLKNVNIESNDCVIADYAFSGCYNLTDIILPEGLKKIGMGAFQGCELLSVVIPDTVETIGQDAFAYCPIVSITLGENVDYIGENAFYGCENLVTIYNNSMLDLTLGSESNGFVAYYAVEITDRLGNVTMRTDSDFEYVLTSDGFGFKKRDNEYILVAYLGTEDSITLPYDINGSGYRLEYFDGGKHIVIPETITKIDENAFSGSQRIESITLSKSVTAIGSNAFRECKNLNNVVLNDGLIHIDELAFYGCEALTSIHLNMGLQRISSGAFMSCGLQSISIPDSVTTVEYSAFSHCQSLKTVTVGNGVVVLENVFEACYNISSISLGDSVQSFVFDGSDFLVSLELPKGLKTLVLQYCPNLQSIEIPNSVSKLSLGGCSSLKEIVLPDALTKIDDYAFEYCGNLEEIRIPEQVTEIGNWAFAYCQRLESVYIPDSVSYIGNCAFQSCSSMQHVKMPDNVTAVGSHAFSDCASLENITLFKHNSFGNRVFSGCSNLNSVTIEEGVRTISYGMFEHCTNLKNVTLPSTITYIDYNAFAYCQNLTCISIPPNVESVQSDAFLGCNSLQTLTFEGKFPEVFDADISVFTNVVFCDQAQNANVVDGIVYNEEFTEILWVLPGVSNVYIPDTVTEVGRRAFANRKNLKEVVLPDSVISIDDHAFEGCDSLETIIIGGSVCSIGESAFADCSRLQGVELPQSVTTIGDGAFAGCSSLRSLNIPQGVSIIPGALFSDCIGLKEISLPTGLLSIGGRAFANCVSLEGIKIPHSVDSIGWSAFENCSSLKDIIIPAGVEKIETYTFQNCYSLKSVTFPEGLTHIGREAFVDCISLSTLELPDSVIEIDDRAFMGCGSITEVTLGKEINRIGVYAFLSCEHLYKITNLSMLNIEIGFSDSHGSISDYAKVIVHSDGNMSFANNVTSFEFVDTSDGWRFAKENGKYTLIAYRGSNDIAILPASIQGESFEISKVQGIKHVVLQEGILEISDYAFYQSKLLESVSIPNSVTRIGEEAFYGCERLFNIVIPDSVIELGWQAFEGCLSLTNVDIGDGLSIIPYRSFADCEQLSMIEFGDNVTELAQEAFIGCANLGKIWLPESILSVGERAFADCSELSDAKLGENLKAIGYYAFSGCTQLKYINIPESVEVIDWNAFYQSGIYNDTSNWSNGMLIYQKWLLAVDDALKYIEYEGIEQVSMGVYRESASLKTAVMTRDLEGLTNAETLVYNHLEQAMYNMYPSTIKNIVLLDSIAANEMKGDMYYWCFSTLSNVTFFVEHLEEELRWDDNFPGWNYGNRVYYKDEWIWVKFYDENGNLLYSAPQLNSAIVRRPVYEPESDLQYTYRVIGWDIDGDGICDNIPATASTDIHAVAVVEKTINFTYGDANGDKKIDGRDVTRLLRYIANYDEETETSTVEISLGADANGDGTINGKDVTRLLRYIANYDEETGDSTVVLEPNTK